MMARSDLFITKSKNSWICNDVSRSGNVTGLTYFAASDRTHPPNLQIQPWKSLQIYSDNIDSSQRSGRFYRYLRHRKPLFLPLRHWCCCQHLHQGQTLSRATAPQPPPNKSQHTSSVQATCLPSGLPETN